MPGGKGKLTAADNPKPFTKDNPGPGRPKGSSDSRTRLRRILEAIQRAKNPVTKQEEDFTTLELMDIALITKALKGDVQAYREVLDRYEGKAVQRTEVSGPEGEAIPVQWIVEVEPQKDDE